MTLKQIKDELLQAAALIDDFAQNHLSIDRETALDKIRKAYESLRFVEEEAPVVVPIVPSEEPSEPVAEPDAETDDLPEVEVEFVMPEADFLEEVFDAFEPEELEDEVELQEEIAEVDEDITQPVAETEPYEEPFVTPTPFIAPDPIVEEKQIVEEEEVEQEPEVISEPEVIPDIVEEEVAAQEVVVEPEPLVEEPVEEEPLVEEETPIVEPPVMVEADEVVEQVDKPKADIVEQSLFGDDDQWSRPAPTSRRKIMALYGAPEQPAEPKRRRVKPERVQVEQTVAAVEPAIADVIESEQVLGETIESAPTIADTITCQVSVADNAPIESLRKSISIADRFMLVRDLFGGDVDMYEDAIDMLDRIDNLDDCIIYITENFSWRPSSDGAKLIVDLLQRKFN